MGLVLLRLAFMLYLAGINASGDHFSVGANSISNRNALKQSKLMAVTPKKYLDKAKDKNDPFRLMGFGTEFIKL